MAEQSEAVLLGSAMLGAVAGGEFASVLEAMSAMSHSGKTISPSKRQVSEYHSAKYRVFMKMYEDQIAYRGLMGD